VRLPLHALFVASLVACSSNPPAPATGDAGTDVPRVGADVVTSTDAPASTDVATTTTTTTTTAAGSVSGSAFGTAVAAIRGGAPDDPQTMVVFIADAPFTCPDVTPGWDSRLPARTHVIELKTFGLTVGTYPIASTDPTMTMRGRALANYATIQRPVATETNATGGEVVITEVLPDGGLVGTFALDFRFADRVTGAFRASYCATGTEP
jgi:hypothetical protein